MMFLLFICTVAFFNFILCDTIDGGNNEIPSEHSLQCDQNDDIYDPSPVRILNTRRKRAVSSETSKLWPYGIIPYVIEPGIPDDIVKTLKDAMHHWSEETCIRFIKRSREHDYISFHDGINCCSWVGRVGGKQRVSVGSRCSSFGVLIHELGHVIGFWHEHSRPDRDYYIKVISDNLVPGAVRNFQKLPNSKVNSFGKLYDYESIMHYGPRHFSSNWKNTIETRLAAAQYYIGQRDYLSPGDQEQANILYNCPRDTSGCSSMIKESAGRVTSPNYPNSYESTLDCVTLIQPDMMGYVLVARILDLEMPDSQNCSEDYVEIRDGPHQDSPLVTRLCGKSHSDAIISVYGTLFIRFRSDSAGSGRGFLLEFETEDFDECVTNNGGCSHFCHNTIGSFYCSCPQGMTLSKRGDYCIDADISGSCTGILTEDSGIIATMGYPNGYIGGLSCYWMVYPPPAKEIRLTFHDFDLEMGNEGDCMSYDFVEISTGSGSLPRRYCGKTLPEPITVNGTRISLRFSSDNMLSGRGFFATYTTVTEESSNVPVCEEKFYSVRGTINYSRDGNVVCDTYTYIIALPSSFQLSYKYNGKLGANSDVSVYRSTTELLTTYRHTTEITGSKTLSNLLKIVVNSTQQDDSFHLSWKSKDKGICGGTRRATKTPQNIYSHRTLNETDLAPHQTCVWSISSKNGVSLNFLTFDLAGDVIREDPSQSRDVITSHRLRRRGGGKCRVNYLEITDGSRKVGRFCNERKQLVYVSKSKNVKLKLVTKRDPGKGFHVKFSRLT
ncbi:dorsal-ventral patterning tolloid-like protein 1 isoform X1 [Bolinopsis microptera]|uniref:dorsal-ventral patterning tolloid-like protein 1 isoform X1 n=2 Tax=Bolinopsis microptera TaxID=2820187 RepID=UPI00307950C9